MTGSSLKTKLKGLLTEIRAEVQALWDSLSDEERSATGEIDHWAPRDHLAHATFWTERLVTQLLTSAGGEPPNKIDDFQKTNDEVYIANKDRSWEDILTWSTEVNRQLHAALDAASEEMLGDVVGPEGTSGRPLWQTVAFTGIYHPMHHAADIYLERGDFESAQSLQELVAEGIASLDESDTWQGTNQYNLACFYALNGKTKRALDLLKTALERAPNLIEWSKQDEDLVSLRELPEFVEMTAKG